MNKKVDGIKKIEKTRKDSSQEKILEEQKKYSRRLVLESIGELSQKKGPLVSDIKQSTKKKVKKDIAKLDFKKEKKIVKKKLFFSPPPNRKKNKFSDNFIDKEVLEENLKMEEDENLIKKEKRKKSGLKSFDALSLKQEERRRRIEAIKKSEDEALRKQIDTKLAEAKETDLSFDELIKYQKKNKAEMAIDEELKKSNSKTKAEEIKKDKKRKKEEEKRIREEEKKEMEKKKREEEKKRKEDEKRKKEEEKKRKRNQRKKELKNKINYFKKSLISYLNSFYLEIKRKTLKTIVLCCSFLLLVFIIYLTFFILIVRFNFDNGFTRKMANIFPFPAFFVEDGMVNYFNYIDIRNELKSEGFQGRELEFLTKKEVASQLILLSLEKKYNILINYDLLKQEKFKKKLSRRIMKDMEINTVALNRIKKINEMIQSGGDFIKISSKYGDSLGKLSLNKQNKKDYLYANEIIGLKKNEISKIIYGENGYYIFKCFQKMEDSSDLSYVFIKGINFDEYFKRTLNSFQMTSLLK